MIAENKNGTVYFDNGSTICISAMKRFLKNYFLLDWTGYHGIPHWTRVLTNGLEIGKHENARLDVIWLFAYLHDCERENENTDPKHGERAVKLAKSLRKTGLFIIDDAGFDLLCYAMHYHTDGLTEGDLTVRCCWDADRLDLARVGKTPDPRLLCTDYGRRPDTIKAAVRRSATMTEF